MSSEAVKENRIRSPAWMLVSNAHDVATPDEFDPTSNFIVGLTKPKMEDVKRAMLAGAGRVTYVTRLGANEDGRPPSATAGKFLFNRKSITIRQDDGIKREVKDNNMLHVTIPVNALSGQFLLVALGVVGAPGEPYRAGRMQDINSVRLKKLIEMGFDTRDLIAKILMGQDHPFDIVHVSMMVAHTTTTSSDLDRKWRPSRPLTLSPSRPLALSPSRPLALSPSRPPARTSTINVYTRVQASHL
jgi:hypothetical protein